jgi:predicted SAM-dependent methyltransferase
LEHFSFEDGIGVMAELHRVLKPGAVARLIVPDAAWVMRCYFESPRELIEHRCEPTKTVMEVVNSYFRQRYEHHFLHDLESIQKQLQQAGFVKVVRVSFGESTTSEALLLDDAKYARESLYIEAQKTHAR